jgi:MFS family permease
MRAGVRPPFESEYQHLPQGILVGIGSVVVIVAAFVASAFPQSEVVFRYAILTFAILAYTAGTVVWTAPLVTAGIGFLVFDGFLVNQLGELSWHGSSDGVRLAVLAAAVIFGRLLGDIFRMPGPASGRKRRSMASSPFKEHFIEEDEHDA